MDISLTTSEIIVTLFCLLLILLSNKFGDSSKKSLDVFLWTNWTYYTCSLLVNKDNLLKIV
jgi:hypothetical protein